VAQTANGQFCLVSMTVKNIGDQSQPFVDQEQKALSPQGSEYTDDLAAGVAAKENNPLNQSINPGNQISTVLVYDIPKSAQINRLQLHDSAFSGGVQVTVT
jgi:hypothetical protein